MVDVTGTMLQINDWVAFYNSKDGKSLFGKITKMNQFSVMVLPKDKKRSIRKMSNQILKISSELIEDKKSPVLDSLGSEINIGDWVAATSGYNTYFVGDKFNGKLVFGEIVKINKSSIEVKFPNRKAIRKLSNQVVKVTPEQLTLKYLTD